MVLVQYHFQYIMWLKLTSHVVMSATSCSFSMNKITIHQNKNLSIMFLFLKKI